MNMHPHFYAYADSATTILKLLQNNRNSWNFIPFDSKKKTLMWIITTMMMLYPKYVPLLLPTLQGRMCTAGLSQTFMNISSTSLVRLVLYMFLVK